MNNTNSINSPIVITGAAGFIGSTLANKLFNMGCTNLVLIDSMIHGNIENLVKPLQSTLIRNDCMNINVLSSIVPSDAIFFHFAGISSLPECESNFPDAIKNNFMSTVNLSYVAILKNAKKFIFASTSAVYENNKENIFDELDETSPDLYYSFSKYLSEKHLKNLALKKISFEITVCRFFNVYGYKQDISRKNPPLTAYIIKCILLKEKITIFNKNSSIKRDYIYIDDLILGLFAIINNSHGKKYSCINFTSGRNYSVEDIIEIFRSKLNNKLEIEYAHPTDIWNAFPKLKDFIFESRIESEVFKSSHGSNEKLKHLLGKKFIFTSMDEGISKMFNFFKLK